MDIRAAALAAGPEGWIARASWMYALRVQPTDGPFCCVIQGNGMHRAPRWEPQREDLIAEDWDVYHDDPRQDPEID